MTETKKGVFLTKHPKDWNSEDFKELVAECQETLSEWEIQEPQDQGETKSRFSSKGFKSQDILDRLRKLLFPWYKFECLVFDGVKFVPEDQCDTMPIITRKYNKDGKEKIAWDATVKARLSIGYPDEKGTWVAIYTSPWEYARRPAYGSPEDAINGAKTHVRKRVIALWLGIGGWAYLGIKDEDLPDERDAEVYAAPETKYEAPEILAISCMGHTYHGDLVMDEQTGRIRPMHVGEGDPPQRAMTGQQLKAVFAIMDDIYPSLKGDKTVDGKLSNKDIKKLVIGQALRKMPSMKDGDYHIMGDLSMAEASYMMWILGIAPDELMSAARRPDGTITAAEAALPTDQKK